MRKRPRALTASAMRVSTRAGRDYAKRLQEPWQNRALWYNDRIGELRYASTFYARQLSRVRFYPARLKDDGTTEPIESGPPVDELARIQDPAGGRSRLQYDYGRLMFITGEGYLFGDRLQKPDERWRFLWRDEIVVEDDGTAFRKDAGGKRIEGETGVAYRLWTPAPIHSDRPTSPMQPVLDIAEELLVLTASVRATATTRLTNGILALASELSPPSAEEGVDDDPEANPFLKAFIEHIQAQIDNPGAAEARVPFILEGAFEYLDAGIKWIQTHDPATDFMERDMRKEAIQRLALGLDMPPEVLLGMTDANHWTAKQVQHDMWRSHGIAVAERMADDLNEAFLRPALREAEYADAEHVVIDYDDSEVVISPDRTEDADNALDRAAISFDGYRELKGIPDSMAPSEEEKMFLLALRTRNLAPLGIAAPQLPGPPQPPSQNGHDAAAEGPPAPAPGRLVSRQEARTASILGAASLALRQCRARAGARLRSDFDRTPTLCPDCKERIDGIPNAVVASAIGHELLEEMGRRDPLGLVRGGTDEFRGILSEWGIAPADAESLCQRLEVYAARTLFETNQPELPPGFVSQVEAAHEVSLAISDG